MPTDPVTSNIYHYEGEPLPHASQFTRPRPVDPREPRPAWLRGFDETLSLSADDLCADLGAPPALRTPTMARVLFDAAERHGFGPHVFRTVLEERGLPTEIVHSPSQGLAWAAFTSEMGVIR